MGKHDNASEFLGFYRQLENTLVGIMMHRKNAAPWHDLVGILAGLSKASPALSNAASKFAACSRTRRASGGPGMFDAVTVSAATRGTGRG